MAAGSTAQHTIESTIAREKIEMKPQYADKSTIFSA